MPEFMFNLPPDPIGRPRSPLAVFLLLLAFVSGLGMALGKPTAGSLDDALNDTISTIWGIVLSGGSFAALVGIFWPFDRRSGLLIKRAGFFSVSIASAIYSAVLFVNFGERALFAGGVVLGFGVACFVQFKAINKVIHAIIGVTKVNEEAGDER